MTLLCHPERSEGSGLHDNDEILRFAQNDNKAVSFENSNIRISDLLRISTRQRRVSIRTQRCWVEFRIYYKDERRTTRYAVITQICMASRKIFTRSYLKFAL